MKVISAIYIAIVLFIDANSFAQNHVDNGGFEIYEETGGIDDSYKKLKSWTMLTPFSFDQHINCQYHIDTNFLSIVHRNPQNRDVKLKAYPYKGKCHIFSNTPFHKTLFQTKLKEPLERGKTYCVEFYYKVVRFLPEMKPYKHEKLLFNIGDFGIYFGNTDYSDTDKYRMDLLRDKIHWKPQIVFYMKDSSAYKDWVRAFAFFTLTETINI